MLARIAARRVPVERCARALDQCRLACWDRGMSEEKPARGGPLVESPVRVEAKLTAELTEVINKLADAGIGLGNDTVRPVGKALAELAVSVLDVVRGPFERRRMRQLVVLAKLTKELQEAQGVAEPKQLPAEVQQLILEKASFVEDDKIRRLWAQLIVNAQAGFQIDAYLFETLSRLSGADALALRLALMSTEAISVREPSVPKLRALGLMEPQYASQHWGARASVARVETHGFILTALARMLLQAATEPLRRNSPTESEDGSDWVERDDLGER